LASKSCTSPKPTPICTTNSKPTKPKASKCRRHSRGFRVRV
jgi:hypothetical protein